jgi:NAD(P)-dependent dehydrogenase (short-subunit alcohol dehydrogenase family)
MQIDGASALVAGGASGLGAATARRLHAGGAHVTIADLNEEKGAALASELGAAFVPCNVTDSDQVQAAVARAHENGGLRISVCCAGIPWAERTVHKNGAHNLDAFKGVIEVNLIGMFNVMSNAAAAMQENEPDDDGERGVIVNTASIAAWDGQIGQIAYATSKGGIVAMTLPAARDLSRTHIRVCAIAPGIFETPLVSALSDETHAALAASIPHPQRFGRPEEFADLAAHIVENGMLNGEVIRLDGALRMPPR